MDESEDGTVSDYTPIQTKWNGFLFRSRLEARWAVFFSHLDIRFFYEPQGFKLKSGELYLPDFFLPDVRMFAEVKCGSPTEQEFVKAQLLQEGSGSSVLFLDGPPDFRQYRAVVMDGGAYTLAPFTLDIDFHGRRHYNKGRLFSDSGQCEQLDFTARYSTAVFASRKERFDGR